MNKYLFTSERLGFRNWNDSDIEKMAAINNDPDVMEFFPATATYSQTAEFIARMKTMFAEKKYCYFAVDELASGNFCGFIGLCDQNFEASFTPCTDIGWRLDKNYWYKGYATEGAKRCLDYGFRDIQLTNIKATSTLLNVKSIKIMQKLCMKQQLFFNHPRLKGDTRLESCVLYEIGSHEFLSE